jgi:hypothetical protein
MNLARGALSLVLLLAGLGLRASLSLGWGAADAPDGTRYKVSPVGLSHVLHPHQSVSPTEDCRWGAAEPRRLCALEPGAQGAALGLRLVPRLIQVAAAIALTGALIWLLPHRRELALLRTLTVLLPALLSGVALALFTWAVPRASLVLGQLSFGVGGTKATLELALLIGVVCGFAAGAAVPDCGWPRRMVQTLWAVLGLAPFVLMFPLLGGLGLGLASLAVGRGLDWLLSGTGRSVTGVG